MYILFLLLLIFTNTTKSNLLVKEKGINVMKRGDVGMVFYITLKNTCSKQYEVEVKMIKCVEMFNEAEVDDEAMTLLGGYMGSVSSNSEKTITLIYPNMYLYNRKGICNIGVTYTDRKKKTKELQVHVKFCTAPKYGKAAKTVKDFYKGQSVRKCDSVDLDPINKCYPVDCMMKYTGARNYFNPHFKRCQKVPICIQDNEKDNPDVAYIPTSNRCRNLLNCVSENDINLLEEGQITNGTPALLSSRGLVIRCNHGNVNGVTGMCDCNAGWESAEEDLDKYIPGLSTYHMCNIAVDSWNSANLPRIRSTALAFAILAVVITMIILFITFGLYGLYICLKNYERPSPFLVPSFDTASYGKKPSAWSSKASYQSFQ